MKANIKYITCIILVAGALFSSCRNFDDMNIDPNNPSPETVDPNLLVSSTFIKGTLNMHLYQRIHNLYVDCYAQYFSNDKYSTTNCVPVDSYTQDYWDEHWIWIDHLNIVIRNNKDNAQRKNTVAIARIWRVWLFHRATDLWGDIPYFNAADGSGIEAPYDTQKDIYYDMLKELTGAEALLDPAYQNPGKNDLLFGGEINKWKQFANSMRLRLAMRMTEADPAKAKAEAEAAVATNNLLAGNDDNVTILRSESYNTDRLGDMQYGNAKLHSGGRQTMSKSMEKLLSGLGGIPFPAGTQMVAPVFVDPRGPVYFNVTNQYNCSDPAFYGRWTGVPSGLAKADQELPENVRTNNSRIGARYISTTNDINAPISYNRNKKMILMNYAEICLLRAEGASRGWNMGGSARAFYEEGIKASMSEAGIPDEIVATYLVSSTPNEYGTTVLFTDNSGENNSGLDKIITQKYLACFPDNGWEAWNDYRRLNMPALDPFVAPETGYVEQTGATGWRGSLRRITYPSQEAIVNQTNYKAAVTRIGGDKTTTRMWWDAKQ